MHGHLTLCYMVVGGNLNSPLNLFISFAKALMEQGFRSDLFLAKDRMSLQMGDQAVLRPALEPTRSDASAVTFERVLNTEEAAALLQIHPKTLQKMAREGTVPAFRIGDLWRFRASALDDWLRSGVSSNRHSCR